MILKEKYDPHKKIIIDSFKEPYEDVLTGLRGVGEIYLLPENLSNSNFKHYFSFSKTFLLNSSWHFAFNKS